MVDTSSVATSWLFKMNFISGFGVFAPSNFSVILQVLVQSHLWLTELHSLYHPSGMMPLLFIYLFIYFTVAFRSNSVFEHLFL